MLKFYRQESVAYSSPSEKFVNENKSQVGQNAFISLKRKKLTAGNSRGGIFGLMRQEGNCGKAEDESGYLERFRFEANRRRRDPLGFPSGARHQAPPLIPQATRYLDRVPTRPA